jgi:SPP1 family predicted phage head-tail adaptor
MTFPYGQTVTLIKRAVSGRDEYGNDTYTESATSVGNCVVAPAGSTENLQFTDQVTTNAIFYLPFGTDVEAVDAIEYSGDRYEVEGQPNEWTPSPFSGHTAPIGVRGKKVSGVSA